MAITFAPKRGAILMCDFDMAFIDPEMRKNRQAVVVSILANNNRHGRFAGTCSLIPFSTVVPITAGPDDIFVPAGSYWSLPKDSWIRCKLLTTVSHDRLDLVLRAGRRHATENISAGHMAQIEAGIRYAMGF